MRDGAAADETARFDAGDLVNLAARPRLHQFIDRAAERPRVAEQRGDVAKHDSRLGIIRDGADRGLEIVFEHDAGHGLTSNSRREASSGIRSARAAFPGPDRAVRRARPFSW